MEIKIEITKNKLGPLLWKHRSYIKPRTKHLLGQGSYGSVVKARDIRLNKNVAVKIISLEKSLRRPKACLWKVFEEVKILQNIRHEHIVLYYDHWVEGPQGQVLDLEELEKEISSKSSNQISNHFLFIELELMDYNLTKWLLKNPTTDMRNEFVREIMEHCCLGLSELHDNNIIHRDVKPDNIVAKAEKENLIWKIVDFGMSTIRCGDEYDSNTTYLGTFLYQSPEMLMGLDYDDRTDVFSLGLALLETLYPFQTDRERDKTFQQIKFGSASSITEIIRKLDPSGTKEYFARCKPILVKMLEPEAESRTRIKIIIQDIKTAFESEVIQELPASSFQAKTPKIENYDVKKQIQNFSGRKQETKQIMDFYNQTTDTGGALLISGIGGQGKTQLSRHFLQELLKIDRSPLITWLSGDSNQALYESLANFASENLGLRLDSKTSLYQLAESVVKKVKKIIKDRWVIVIDNVDKSGEEFEDFFPVVELFLEQGTAFILVTSRRTDALPSDAEILQLQELKDEDAHSLITSSIQVNNEEDVTKLCKTLQNYALALQTAVGFIRHRQRGPSLKGKSYNVSDYLQEFEKDNPEPLLHKQQFKEYDKTVFKVIEMAYDALSNEGEVGVHSQIILKILSLQNPDGIDLDLLAQFVKPFFGSSWSDSLFESCLFMLKKFSLISIENYVITVHRIVQKIIRLRMKASGKFVEIGGTLCEAIEISKLSKPHLSNMVYFWKIVSKEEEIIKKHAIIADKIFEQMIDVAMIREMIPFAEENFSRFSSILGPLDVNTMLLEYRVTYALYIFKRFDEALAKLQILLPKRKTILGENHPLTLKTMQFISTQLRELKRFEESLSWHLDLLERRKNAFGADHASTVNTMHNLSLVLLQLGNYEEALSLYAEVFRHRGQETDRGTLAGRFCLATCTEGKDALELYAKLMPMDSEINALQQFRAMVELRGTSMGHDHAHTLSNKYTLATALIEVEKGREEGIEMLRDVLALSESVSGETHPDTVRAREKLETIMRS